MSVRSKFKNSSGRRLLLSLLVGIVAVLVALLHFSIGTSLLLGWDAVAIVFVVSVFVIVGGMDGARTKEFALREDPSRVSTDVILIAASIASLLAVAYVLVLVGNTNGMLRTFLAALGILSVIVSWLLVHTVYMLRYAGLYYSPHVDGRVDFNSDDQPRYVDFAYLAFTVGMTYQVSDTALVGTKFRATALKHALLSFVFGTIIIATTINLIAGLGK